MKLTEFWNLQSYSLRKWGIFTSLLCLFMFLSLPFWAANNIIVSFNAQTSKDLTFQLFYTTNAQTGFSEKESQRQFVKAGDSKVVFSLPIKKIVKLRIDEGSNPGKVEISDIRVLGDRKVKLNNGRAWTYNSHIEQSSFDGSTLTLVSNQQDPYIVYKGQLNLAAVNHMDFSMFVLSFIAALIVSYLLTFYRVKFSFNMVLLFACLMYIVGVLLFVYHYNTMRGDSAEYWAMLEALKTGSVAIDFDVFGKYGGIFEANDGKFYSYHFWLYPLLATPIGFVTDMLHLRTVVAFYYLNVIIFLLMLAMVCFYSPAGWNKKQKLWALSLLAFSPTVPYLTWVHPEVFATALVVMSLCFYMRNNLYLAVLFSGMAASQNPPIGLFTVFCGSLYLLHIIKQKKIVWRDFFVMGLCAIPLVLSPLFYYVKFGTFNLIQKLGYSDWDQVGFGRFFSFWFDINQGMVACSVVLVFVFLYTICKNLYQRNLKYFSLVILSFLMVIMASTTTNWNHGQILISRYTTWIYPFMVFYVVATWNFQGIKNVICAVIITLSVAFQIIGGLWNGNYTAADLKPWAKVVLEYCPACYNPDFAIFKFRNTKYGSSYIFVNSGLEVRKMMTSYNILQKDRNMYDIHNNDWFNNQLDVLKSKPDTIQYVNVPRSVLFVKN